MPRVKDSNGGAMFRAAARNREPVASPNRAGEARGEAESFPVHSLVDYDSLQLPRNLHGAFVGDRVAELGHLRE